MAELVMGVGAPHTPFFPGIAKAQGTAARVTVLFDQVRRELEAAEPDLILMFTADHFVSFFFNNMPTFPISTIKADLQRFAGASRTLSPPTLS